MERGYILITISCCILLSTALPVIDDGLSHEFLSQEKSDLTALELEASNVGYPFMGAWENSTLSTFYKLYEKNENMSSKDLNVTYRQTEILNLGEIRILISYCYKEPPFYQDLNKNMRENGGEKYPETKRILKAAVEKLKAHQEGTTQALPTKLFRNEPVSLFDVYQKLFNTTKQGELHQFTSSSRSEEKAKNFIPGPNRMIIVFENPKVGGDVDDFSIFDEFEVLLPFSSIYQVKKAEKDGDKMNVILTGPRSGDGILKLNISVFIVCIYISTLKP